MKQILVIIISILYLNSYSQDKEIKVVKELVYDLYENGEKAPQFQLKNYITNNDVQLLLIVNPGENPMDNIWYVVYNNQYLLAKILPINNAILYADYFISDFDFKDINEYSYCKKKEVQNETEITYFLKENDEEVIKITFDSNSSIDNLSTFTLEKTKGLIKTLSLIREKATLKLVNENDVNYTILWNEQKFKNKIQDLTFRKKELEEAYKNAVEAEEVDAVEEYAGEIDDDESIEFPGEYDDTIVEITEQEIPNYVSNYKYEEIEELSLAIKTPENEFLFNVLPKYCRQFTDESNVWNFSNKKLKLHAQNYAGQLCDLYLFPYVDNVDYIRTIDSMRKSLLEIEKIRPHLTKEDKELLKLYFETLD